MGHSIKYDKLLITSHGVGGNVVAAAKKFIEEAEPSQGFWSNFHEVKFAVCHLCEQGYLEKAGNYTKFIGSSHLVYMSPLFGVHSPEWIYSRFLMDCLLDLASHSVDL